MIRGAFAESIALFYGLDMEDRMTIRPGGADEASRVLAAAEMFEAERSVRDGFAPDETCYVAVIEGSPVGVVIGRLGSEVLHDDSWIKAGLVSYLGVLPERQGEGIGARLLRVFLAEAQREGSAWVSLLVPPRREARLVSFYRGNRFAELEGNILRFTF